MVSPYSTTGGDAARYARLAQAMQQQAFDASPVQSPWQAIARVYQGYRSGQFADKAEAAKRQQNEALAKALMGMQAGQPLSPDVLGTDMGPQLAMESFKERQRDAAKLGTTRTRETLQEGRPFKITEEYAGGNVWKPLGDPVPAWKPKDEMGGQSRYYVVDSGSGKLMVDKFDGTAQTLGQDQDGNLIPLGKPFKFLPDQNNQPTNAYNPSATSQGQAKPVLPAAIDPGAQGRVTTAKEEAKAISAKRFEATPAYNSIIASIAPLNRMETTAQELYDSPGLDTITGLYGKYAPNISDEARNAQAKMETMKSQIAQNVLQMYRSMSQTGGAVGQVSNFEQQMFQNNLAALDQAQTPAEFRKQLTKLIEFVEGSKERLVDAYRREYESIGNVPTFPDTQKTPPKKNLTDDDLLKKYGGM